MYKNFCTAAALIVLFFTDNLYAQFSAQVIGGHPAASGKYPWMAALVLTSVNDSTEAQFCGGTIIAEKFVLTAAHCVYSFYDEENKKPVGVRPDSFKIFYGSQSLPYDQGTRADVLGVIIHPDYNPVTLENDLALVKISGSFPAPYLKTAGAADSAFLGTAVNGTLIGWGLINDNASVLPIELQEADIPLKDDAACTDNLGRWYKPDSMMCAGTLAFAPDYTGGVSSCNGDSGGPLLVDDGLGGYIQAGIVSWGLSGYCAGSFYGVYSEVLAAENFVSQRPVIAPYPASLPELKTSSAGIECIHGQFLGEPAEAYTYKWGTEEFKDGDYVITKYIDGATGKSYSPAEEDIGKYIACEVSASNAGGSSRVASESLYIDYTYTGTPLPDSTPSAPDFTDDLTGPNIESLSISCKKKQCTGIILVTDSNGLVTSVSASVSFNSSNKCKKDKTCAALRQEFQLNPLSNEVFKFTFANKNRTKGRIVYYASDQAGNGSSIRVKF